MNLPEHIDKKLNEMPPCEKKEVWEQLKNTNHVYVVVPTIDSLNFRYDTLKLYLKMKPLSALKQSSGYYHHARDIYNNYDFILNKDFFESSIHQNAYDAIYVTEKTRENLNKICWLIDEQIDKLEKYN